jgi:DNA-binding NtrC family response regulator
MSQASVLIVDDEPLVRQTLSEWMRRKNFRVFEAEDGRQAMERIRRDEPDIVISDVVMPGMDGVQLLKEAKADIADIPFLMISGFPSRTTAADLMKHGASDYLPKPFTPEELARRVNRTLLQKSAGSAFAPTQGVIMGTVLSAVAWALVILALAGLFH